MPWTKDQIETIPEVYRDFMMALKPIIDTRQSVMTVSGIPLSSVYNALSTRYDYSPQQVRKIAKNLEENGMIEQDHLGFITLKSKGEALIKAITGPEESPADEVPLFPHLP